MPAEHAAGGGLRPEGVLHGGREGPGRRSPRRMCSSSWRDQRGDRTVVRLADRESGLSARTIARRLSSVSGLYAYLVARGDTPVQVNPVPRGLLTRRQGGSRRSRTAPLVRVPRTLPRILSPREADRLVGALRTHRDRAMVLAMLLAGLRRCEVLGLRFADVQVADRRLVVVEGKGGHHRVVPAANRFFDALGAYLHDERPGAARTDRVFVVLKGPRRGLPLSAEGLDEILSGARRRAGLEHATCHELRHTCLTRLREAGMALEAVQAQAGHRSDRVDPGLPAPGQRLAGRRVPARGRADRRRYRRRRRDAGRADGGRPVSALPARGPAASRAVPGSIAAAQWAQIRAAAPQVAATIRRYLQRLAAFLAPAQRGRRGERAAPVRPVDDHRRRAGRPSPRCAAMTSRTTRYGWPPSPGPAARSITAETHRQRIRTVRAFFERIIEWDWPDAPPRNPVIAGDIPKKPEPLPKFLDDRDAARLMAAARASTDPRDRLVVELLARTGMRAGELAGLEADAVVQIGAGHWLRIPLGKLRNDRYVPLHPELVRRCSPPGPRPTWSTSAAASGWSPTTAARWTGTSSAASSPASAVPPAFPACTRTGCATRWPPRPSTAACGWRPSPPCSATARWR